MKNEIMNILNSFGLGDQLLILTDEESDNLSRQCGIDVDNPDYQRDLKIVAPIRPTAQCCMGLLGRWERDNYDAVVPELMKKWVSKEAYDFMLKLIGEHVVIYIDEMCRQLQSFNGVVLEKMVLNLVGHELRHAHQGLEMIDLQTNTLQDVVLYATQRHELDAYAYGQALVTGEATLDEVATWQPSQELLDQIAGALRAAATRIQNAA